MIKEIETAEDFPIGKDPHCNYCTYKSICPKFVPPRILTIDDGITLVDELVEKQAECKIIEHRIDEIKTELLKLAESGNYNVIVGSAYEIPIKRELGIDNDKSDWVAFKQKASNLGVLDDYLGLVKNKISGDLRKGNLDQELRSCLKTIETVSTGTKRKRRMGEED